MLLVGLTGGIGSGKSTVSRLFADHGIPIIDTDLIAREVVMPGEPALQQLASEFGPDILDSEGCLNRAVMRERVFRKPELLKRLEAILHPLIRSRMQQQLEVLHAPYVIIAIPLLVEKGWQQEVDRVLVVDTEENSQIERTLLRDAVSEETVQRILQSQASRQQRLAVADDIIDNNGDIKALKAAVGKLHQYYLSLAADA